MQNIVAIVVTYNRKNMLKGCISKVLNQTQKCDILIVDNASTDGTDKLVLKLQTERIHYQKLSQNIGGAGGFFEGILWAMRQKYEFFWLLDDDTFPEKNALEELISASEKLGNKYGFLSSVVLWKDGTECKMNRQVLSKRYYEHINLIEDGIILANQATFVSLFLNRDVVARVGLPLKEFFIWGDDVEYTRRISVRFHYPCYLVGKSKVIHMMKNNIGSNIVYDNIDRINRYYYAYRNENYTFRKEGIKAYAFWFMRCLMCIMNIIRKSEHYKFKRLKVMLKGILNGFLFHPKVQYYT